MKSVWWIQHSPRGVLVKWANCWDACGQVEASLQEHAEGWRGQELEPWCNAKIGWQVWEGFEVWHLALQAGSDRPRTRFTSKQILQISAALFYAVCAVSMNFVNKATMLQFPHTNVLLLNQMVLALIIISAAKVSPQAQAMVFQSAGLPTTKNEAQRAMAPAHHGHYQVLSVLMLTVAQSAA